MVITTGILRSHGACKKQIMTFKKEFGDSVVFGKGVAVRAAKAGLNASWVAERLMPKSVAVKYRVARTRLSREYVIKKRNMDRKLNNTDIAQIDNLDRWLCLQSWMLLYELV